MPPTVVPKQAVANQLQKLKQELEAQLAEVNAAIAFVQSNQDGAESLIRVVLKRGIRGK